MRGSSGRWLCPWVPAFAWTSGSCPTRRVTQMTANLDPVTLEVVRNALPAVANEMAVDLQRTSYNMMIYEGRDFCTALVNTAGGLYCQNMGGASPFVADLGVIITHAMSRD